MIILPNGCKCSEPKIHPQDFSTNPDLLNYKMRCQYRFYNQNDFVGTYIIIKKGFKNYKTLSEKRAYAKQMTADVVRLLKNGFNPTKKAFIDSFTNANLISPKTLFLKALQAANAKLNLAPQTTKELNNITKAISKLSNKLGFSTLQINEVSRKHWKVLLEQSCYVKSVKSAHKYNKYRAYMLMTYKELIECEAVEHSPLANISKMKAIKQARETTTSEQRKLIDTHLLKLDKPFRNFVQIFFHSGARLEELLRIKIMDVDLPNQKFKVLIKKGVSQHYEYRTIKSIAVPFWQIAIENGIASDYLFSHEQQPGPEMVSRDRLTNKWKRLVKDKLGITADLYSLKHSNLDAIAATMDMLTASRMAGHTNTVTTARHYATGEVERMHNLLKSIENEF